MKRICDACNSSVLGKKGASYANPEGWTEVSTHPISSNGPSLVLEVTAGQQLARRPWSICLRRISSQVINCLQNKADRRAVDRRPSLDIMHVGRGSAGPRRKQNTSNFCPSLAAHKRVRALLESRRCFLPIHSATTLTFTSSLMTSFFFSSTHCTNYLSPTPSCTAGQI